MSGVESKKIATSGVTITTSAVSANASIPPNSSGTAPNYVRVQTTNYAFIKFGAAGVAATSNDVLISPNEPEVFSVNGFVSIAAIQQAAAGVVNITPLDNV